LIVEIVQYEQDRYNQEQVNNPSCAAGNQADEPDYDEKDNYTPDECGETKTYRHFSHPFEIFSEGIETRSTEPGMLLSMLRPGHRLW
jgi:hypothetical protein